MSTRAATGIGFISILLWSQLAVLATLTGAVPPFQLVAMSFALAGAIGLVYLLRSTKGWRSLTTTPPGAWTLGVAGLFGFHFFFFLAMRSAPAAEASLITYLWPLLIVLFSAALPARVEDAGLKWWHISGAALGLAGTIIIVTGSNSGNSALGGNAIPWLGYGAALTAALLWSSYSVANRRYAKVPSTSVAGFCLVTAIAATAAHLGLETTLWPASMSEWMAIAGLGLGPVGAAFYFWDYGVKHGDIRVLGAAAYTAPLLSTISLVAFGLSKATPSLWTACALITIGAALAAKDLLLPHQN
ncbi:MAG: aromatic amino acid exporter YddG [Alphaproteobacteria bacterium]